MVLPSFQTRTHVPYLNYRGGASQLDFSWTPHLFETGGDILNFTGGTILLVASFISILQTLVLNFNKLFGMKLRTHSFNKIRLNLGTMITFSLELLVCADVIETLTKPAAHYRIEQLIKIAFVVAIRTCLAYFQGKELEELEKKVEGEAKMHF